MWERAWSLPEQLTSSPRKRAVLESCFMLGRSLNFHLEKRRILWIEIYCGVLWAKPHSYFFLIQSLVQNKSIFSFPLILSAPLWLWGGIYLARPARRNFWFKPAYVFSASPTEFLANILWAVMHHRMRPSQRHAWLWATPSHRCDQRGYTGNKMAQAMRKHLERWRRAETVWVTDACAATWRTRQSDASMCPHTYGCLIQPELLGFLPK